ncbi:unnamed protein product [Ilex paraguariensis]|uniref:Uncharacterized protein n=1 Tax=Ilex paraguariensis TaxID=185542 RepID=A0ABC8UPV3_9AQUA
MEMVGGFLKNCYHCKKKILEDAEVFMYGLGFVIDFLSKATLVGFIAGVAIIVSLQQLKELLGIVHFTTKMQIIVVLSSILQQKDEKGHLAKVLLLLPFVSSFILHTNAEKDHNPSEEHQTSLPAETILPTEPHQSTHQVVKTNEPNAQANTDQHQTPTSNPTHPFQKKPFRKFKCEKIIKETTQIRTSIRQEIQVQLIEETISMAEKAGLTMPPSSP